MLTTLKYFSVKNISLNRYVIFRARLAHFAILDFVASFRKSIDIIFVVFAPVIIGFLALLVAPLLYAPLLSLPIAFGIVVAQSLVVALPVWMLRKRLLPASVSLWSLSLPISRGNHLFANAIVAGALLPPILICYGVSMAIWIYQWPAWLRPIWHYGLLIVLASLVSTWIVGTAVLTLRHGRVIASTKSMGGCDPVLIEPGATGQYTWRHPRYRLLHLWHSLFWLYFWRSESFVGQRQTIMLFAATIAVVIWMLPVWPFTIPRAIFSILVSSLLVLITDRGDKAVAEQIRLIRPILVSWPIKLKYLEQFARYFSLLPSLIVLGSFGTAAYLSRELLSNKVAVLYLGVGCLSQIAIIYFDKLEPQGRVLLILISIGILSAVGSELWR